MRIAANSRVAHFQRGDRPEYGDPNEVGIVGARCGGLALGGWGKIALDAASLSEDADREPRPVLSAG